MDENQTTNSTTSNPDSFDLATSMANAANSVNADTFAFLVVPIGLAVLIAVFLIIFLWIRRIKNRKTFETLIEEEVRSAENGPKTGALPRPSEKQSWTIPDAKDLRNVDLEKADQEEPSEGWTVPEGDQEPADGEDSVEFAPATVPTDVQEIKAEGRSDWLNRLRAGLTKTRDAISGGFRNIIGSGRKLDSKLLEQIHEQLYRADIGVKTCDRLVKKVETTLGRESDVDFDKVSDTIREEVATILEGAQQPLNEPEESPWVILVVGVNGVGKTTTIGKLAAHFIADGKTVLLAAADTFRAAAIEQLQTWGQRLGVDVIAHQAGADPAAVAFDAVKAAKARGHDVLIIDTAGRLHSKKELMDELNKIHRVIGRDCPGAPHETWLVIDATTGQNANMQVTAFREVVKLSGLVVTKLDGTAKGGVVVGIADQHQLPIRYIGVGEKAADLREFNAEEFAKTLI